MTRWRCRDGAGPRLARVWAEYGTEISPWILCYHRQHLQISGFVSTLADHNNQIGGTFLPPTILGCGSYNLQQIINNLNKTEHNKKIRNIPHCKGEKVNNPCLWHSTCSSQVTETHSHHLPQGFRTRLPHQPLYLMLSPDESSSWWQSAVGWHPAAGAAWARHQISPSSFQQLLRETAISSRQQRGGCL